MSTATPLATLRTAQHAADSHDVIRVHGARENNLKDISIEIPKRRLTVFTGVSGSGKSSLVFDTIAAESQRLINETYSAFVQGFMPTLARPEVDVLEGLTSAIIVDQERMGADPRSTVGTATDANAMLRILFSRLGQPHIGPPSAFAFNVPSVRASGGITVERGNKTTTEAATYSRIGGMSTSPSSTTTRSRLPKERSPFPAGSPTAFGLYRCMPNRASSTRTSRSATSPGRRCTTSSTKNR
jgi:energy-coupling factor transporter ATP-binding protein EcfA2